MSSLAKGLAKSKIESQYSRQSPWSAEAWQAARDAYLSGTDSPPPRFPIVISEDSLFSTAEKLQRLADLSLPLEVETTTTAPMPWEDANSPASNREVRFCDVDWDQRSKIKKVTEGESILVWFKGTIRFAWVAESLKPVSQNLNIEEPPPRFPIIICQDGLFSTAEKLQQFTNLPMLPEIETTRIVPISYDDADGPPADSKEVQICSVDVDQKINIDYLTEGETIKVWFKGETVEAWLARSLRRSQSIDADF
ncbi:hypothetical protein V500_02134 [Pseudogymnoascus sp. VKM F-4518 (FW-2643)]|nr:hypothetical protein V500_02134 [Pseudogymnoascus sp. VKM F-4518 (FW-2643)]